MKRFASQLKKQAESVKLSAIERRDLRERLETYLEYHPLPEKSKAKHTINYGKAEPYRVISLAHFHIKAFAGVFAIILLVGIPLIAERTLPGNPLYTIKVQFNEELRSTLALSPYEKVEWEAERLSRRIAEARLLASEGKLTEAAETEVVEAVRAHSDAAQQEIAELRETDAEAAAIAEIVFASALDVQSVVLRAEREKASTSMEGNAIASAVEEQLEEANQNQFVSEEIPSAKRLFARIEIETTRSHELLKSIKKYAGEQEVAAIERRLEDVNRKLAKAFSLLEDDERQARTLLRESLHGVKRLTAFMTYIDVRESVGIEDLVPLELTDDEYMTEVAMRLATTGAAILTIEEYLATTTKVTGSVDEKVLGGLEELYQLYEAATSSLAEANFELALLAANDAVNLAQDLLTLLDIEGSEEPKTPESETATSTPSEVTDKGPVDVSTSTPSGVGTSSESVGGGEDGESETPADVPATTSTETVSSTNGTAG